MCDPDAEISAAAAEYTATLKLSHQFQARMLYFLGFTNLLCATCFLHQPHHCHMTWLPTDRSFSG